MGGTGLIAAGFMVFVFAFIGWAIGSNKGIGAAGFALGLFLGPIGLIIVALLPPSPEAAVARSEAATADLRRCPHCAEQIQRAAKVCRYCQRDVEPVGAPVSLEDEEAAWERWDPPAADG